MRATFTVLFLVALLAQSGCATILTGSSKTIRLESTPSGANVAVVGGTLGDALLKGKSYSDKLRLAIKFLKEVAPENWHAGLDQLAVFHVEEFLTLVLPMVRLGEKPEILRHLPPFDFPPMTDFALLQILGVEEYGVAPLKAKVGKGKEYAVLFWKKSHKARVIAMDKSFNPVFLLNILNAFLLCPIDIASGAWFSVGPAQVEAELEPLPPQPTARTR